ncbi:adenylate/guanylate cyclase domain-containing protein [Aquiflexum lacus]|uniref:adenylate/guanylate cyclase domain-containing protein n=1 Tax=Aquiflexum lacus TaxID=2483805 RepID=UPI001893CBF2|nr:adenylate/guanylate cyclase domain-containing protein [Aquiflexum lacus]
MLSYFRQLIFLFLLSFFFTSCTEEKKPTAEKGILEASEWNFQNKGIIPLNGEWEFYWNHLLDPTDFITLPTKSYIEIPGVWNGQVIDNVKLPGSGFATYRLLIKTSGNNERLGIRIPFHFTAYKLWINDNLLAENGKVGTSKEEMIPQTLPQYIYFDTEGNEIAITLQVSNFYFDKGGTPAAYKLGNENQIKKMHLRQFAIDLFLTGSLFIMAFYHLGLYYLRRKEISTLYFSILCFLIMLRTIGLGETFLISLYPEFNFEIYIKLIFLGAFLGPSIFTLFIENLFPEDSKPILGKISIYMGVIFSLSLLFPAKVSTFLLNPFYLVLAFTLFYQMYVLIKATWNKRDGALIASVGMFVMFLAAFNDILFDSQIINSGYYTQYGLLFLIFCQSFLISLRFSKAFTSVENLSQHILKIYKANSRFVPSEFLSFLGKESIVDVHLGDHVIKDMTIFFADIRSFTTISESMTPEENFNFINSILKRISPIVRKNNGFIDKFMGDSIMALFPLDPKDAITTAGELLKELESFNDIRIKSGLQKIDIGIGINSGSLMLGTIGEEERMDGTVISDAVNLASRLESLTKVYGSNIIVSEHLLKEVSDNIRIDYRFLGNVQIKGKSGSVAIYEIFSFDESEIFKAKLKTKTNFEKAINCYQNKDFSGAKILFEGVLEDLPNDKAAEYYLDKVSVLI